MFLKALEKISLSYLNHCLIVFSQAKKIIDDLSERVIDTGAAKSLPETSVSGLMSKQQFKEQVKQNIKMVDIYQDNIKYLMMIILSYQEK